MTNFSRLPRPDLATVARIADGAYSTTRLSSDIGRLEKQRSCNLKESCESQVQFNTKLWLTSGEGYMELPELMKRDAVTKPRKHYLDSDGNAPAFQVPVNSVHPVTGIRVKGEITVPMSLVQKLYHLTVQNQELSEKIVLYMRNLKRDIELGKEPPATEDDERFAIEKSIIGLLDEYHRGYPVQVISPKLARLIMRIISEKQ